HMVGEGLGELLLHLRRGVSPESPALALAVFVPAEGNHCTPAPVRLKHGSLALSVLILRHLQSSFFCSSSIACASAISAGDLLSLRLRRFFRARRYWAMSAGVITTSSARRLVRRACFSGGSLTVSARKRVRRSSSRNFGSRKRRVRIRCEHLLLQY